MITLTWLPNFHAYAVRRNGNMLGLVRFQFPFPFRPSVQIA
ncbi:MAG: hypothetical protein AB7V27_08760 [Candidatus Binatia bacterium]